MSISGPQDFRGYFQSATRIVLTVDPMLPANEVAAASERARTMLRAQLVADLPRPGLASEYNADLAVFVMQALVQLQAPEGTSADRQWVLLKEYRPAYLVSGEST